MTECQDSNVQLFATYFKNTDVYQTYFLCSCVTDHRNNSYFWPSKTNELQWRLAFNNCLTRCFSSARIDLILKWIARPIPIDKFPIISQQIKNLQRFRETHYLVFGGLFGSFSWCNPLCVVTVL